VAHQRKIQLSLKSEPENLRGKGKRKVAIERTKGKDFYHVRKREGGAEASQLEVK